MSGLGRVLAQLALVAGFVLPAGNARAEDDGTCKRDVLPAPHETEFPLLYEPRHDELTIYARYMGSYAPVLSAVDFGVGYGFAPLDQRLHLGLTAGGTAGEWGSDRRGPLALTLGARVAYDLWRKMTGVIDIYAVVESQFLLFSRTGDPVFRPGAGAGIRVGRMLGVEATFSPLVSLGDSFARGEKFDAGFGIGVSYDFCNLGSFCNETSRTMTEHDLTPKFYEAAAEIRPTDLTKQAALCKAVSLALDAGRYHPHDDIDSTEAFLRGLEANLDDLALKTAVHGLRAKHQTSRDDWNAGHDKERSAAADGLQIAEHCVYEPSPMELQSLFGCEGPR
jgi:hypothetical protein